MCKQCLHVMCVPHYDYNNLKIANVLCLPIICLLVGQQLLYLMSFSIHYKVTVIIVVLG